MNKEPVSLTTDWRVARGGSSRSRAGLRTSTSRRARLERRLAQSVVTVGAVISLAGAFATASATGRAVKTPSGTSPKPFSSASSVQLSASVYPPARTQNAGGLGSCPSLAGLVPRSGSAEEAQATVSAFLAASTLSQAQRLSDRAWWPQLQASMPLHPVPVTSSEMHTGALSGPLLRTVAQFCGATTANASWQVSVCGAGGAFGVCSRRHPATVSQVLVLSRAKHNLVWLIGSS